MAGDVSVTFTRSKKKKIEITKQVTTFQIKNKLQSLRKRDLCIARKGLTFRRRNFLLNFSTPCIYSVNNNTRTKKGSIMK